MSKGEYFSRLWSPAAVPSIRMDAPIRPVCDQGEFARNIEIGLRCCTMYESIRNQSKWIVFAATKWATVSNIYLVWASFRAFCEQIT